MPIPVSRVRLLLPTLFLISPVSINPALAQITAAPDSTGTVITPTNSPGTAPSQRFDITGGTLSADGTNLFQSFEQFNLNADQIANFLASPDIRNILGRVVGGDASIIDGLVEVAGSNANLFLINPAGLIFGPNASLNVSGSFTATTADSIGFAGGQFNALGANDFATLVGEPNTFTFATDQPGAIINSGVLSVATEQNLTLLGGSVISTGILAAPGGQITVTTVPGENLVRINQEGLLLSLEIEPIGATAAPPSLPISSSLPALLTGDNINHVTGVTVTADGSVQLTSSGTQIQNGDIAAGTVITAGPNGGAVVLAAQGDIITNSINTSKSNLLGIGNAGDVSLTAGGDITFSSPLANVLAISSNGDGGNISFAAGGNIQFLEVMSIGINGNGGDITIMAGGDITGGGIQTGGTFNGGDIRLSSGGTANITGTLNPRPTSAITSFSICGNSCNGIGGNITLDATTAIITRLINTSGVGGSGDITLTSDNVDFISVGGLSPSVSGAGNLLIQPITPEQDIAIASLPPTSALSLTLDELGSIRDGFSAITIGRADGSGNITVANDITFSDPIVLRSPTDTGTINTQGSNLQGSDDAAITLLANQSIDTSRINTAGQAVTITSNAGDINVGGALDTSSDTGAGGAIALISSAGKITTQAIDTSSTLGAGGQVTLSAIGDIQVDFINAAGATNGGSVDITTENFFRAQQTFTAANGLEASIANVSSTNSSPITIRHGGGLTGTPFEVGQGTQNGTQGAIVSRDFSITPFQSFTDSFTVGDISILTQDKSLPTQPPVSTPASPSSPPETHPPTTELTTTPPETQTPETELFTPPPALPVPLPEIPTLPPEFTGSSSTIQVASPEPVTTPGELPIPPPELPIELAIAPADSASDSISVLVNPIEPTLPANSFFWVDPTAPGASEFQQFSVLTMANDNLRSIDLEVVELEAIFAQAFLDHFGQSEAAPVVTLPEIRRILRQGEIATGTKSAVIYAFFTPSLLGEQLELLLLTADDQPIRKKLNGVTRSQVEPMAAEFFRQVTNRITLGDQYLPPAQQLYQWLIAPLEADLQSQEIQHLSFIMDSGLRSLPLAALHNGQNFLIEDYRIGLMPALSLTNTQYTDLSQTQILAMGASDFKRDVPLPAVLTELSAITQDLWSGDSFHNKAFTLENLKANRRQHHFGIIHLATHAVFKPGEPDNSYIRFWNQNLSLDQLQQLDLRDPPVELLVLSACSTALGDEAAELGFAGLAIQSGAKSVLASLWPISDEGTLGFMAEFYRQLRTAPSKAAALNQAQIAMLNEQVLLTKEAVTGSGGESIALPPELIGNSNQKLSHPFYWSTFTLIGSPW
ncbi:MAG: CHAT domain-containing protein [Cyanothece sp. SIO1E1]|nr:CHAT domain-containing protein [Cyanothece sp. SIO1E1]